MGERVQSIITQTDLAHGGLGFAAVLNGYWTDYLNPVVQPLVAIGGLVYLFWMIRAKIMEWKLSKLEYDEKKKLEEGE